MRKHKGTQPKKRVTALKFGMEVASIRNNVELLKETAAETNLTPKNA